MPKAMWNDLVVAESDDIVLVEGNRYFPRSALREDLIRESDTRTVCPWKGTACYHSLEHDGRISTDAVWYYPTPAPEADMVRDRIAFSDDVQIID
ncbi:DUF427 domain-containing protein [Salinispora arenicola]|uniref:DUF427 domain-containing protein n=1 Tax=Salinispora arenicola TaxID=168697 RepID=UPI00035FBD63|nr:DUF427 domain-containing protein [Salinispora arenicola]NIL42801.1 DUF427 domain-containing protein [Salinispora arenicola]